MSKGKFYNWYNARIKHSYPVARTFLEVGQICQIRYTPTSTNKTKNYFCIILHKGIGRLTPTKKMHLLSLENMPPKYFEEIVDQVGLEYSRYFKNVRKLKLEKLLMEQKDAKRFYIRELKPHIQSKYQNTYRTFNIGRTSIMKVIDFDWPGNFAQKEINETAKEQKQKHPTKGSLDELNEKFNDTGLKEE